MFRELVLPTPCCQSHYGFGVPQADIENGHIGQASGGSPRQKPVVAEIASAMLTLSNATAVAVHGGPSRMTPTLLRRAVARMLTIDSVRVR